MADKTVTVTIELKFEVGAVEAMILRDLLPEGKTSTMITENTGIYDYEPDEKIVSVEIA